MYYTGIKNWLFILCFLRWIKFSLKSCWHQTLSHQPVLHYSWAEKRWPSLSQVGSCAAASPSTHTSAFPPLLQTDTRLTGCVSVAFASHSQTRRPKQKHMQSRLHQTQRPAFSCGGRLKRLSDGSGSGLCVCWRGMPHSAGKQQSWRTRATAGKKSSWLENHRAETS